MKKIKYPEKFDNERIKVFNIINKSEMPNELWIYYLQELINDLIILDKTKII